MAEGKEVKMAFLIDATISMDALLGKLKLILPEIFEDVYATLREKKVEGGFKVQLVLYRNYNSTSE